MTGRFAETCRNRPHCRPPGPPGRVFRDVGLPKPSLDAAGGLTNAYIADKRTLRRRVSDGAAITLDDAKKCLTALLFGAVVQPTEKAMRLNPQALVEAIGVPAALRLREQPDFMALYEEIGRVGDAVVKGCWGSA